MRRKRRGRKKQRRKIKSRRGKMERRRMAGDCKQELRRARSHKFALSLARALLSRPMSHLRGEKSFILLLPPPFEQLRGFSKRFQFPFDSELLSMVFGGLRGNRCILNAWKSQINWIQDLQH